MNDDLTKYIPIFQSMGLKQIDTIYGEKLANIFDNTIQHIREKHSDKSLELKVAGAYVIKEIAQQNETLKDKNDIVAIIDDFYYFYDKNYQTYIDNLEIISDPFYTDILFYKSFINKQLNKQLNKQ